MITSNVLQLIKEIVVECFINSYKSKVDEFKQVEVHFVGSAALWEALAIEPNTINYL